MGVSKLISKIQIKLTRQSVCMGDDASDHTKIINISLQRSTTETIMGIAKEYLARIAGYGHSWTCILNGEKCAIIEGNCKNITSVSDTSFSETNELHFDYHSATY